MMDEKQNKYNNCKPTYMPLIKVLLPAKKKWIPQLQDIISVSFTCFIC